MLNVRRVLRGEFIERGVALAVVVVVHIKPVGTGAYGIV
jgi:hypothetical protein